jgi:hypothetical protein
LLDQRRTQLIVVLYDQNRALIGHRARTPLERVPAPSTGSREVEHSQAKAQASRGPAAESLRGICYFWQ